MVNYQNGKVYIIKSSHPELQGGFYVGSTAQTYLSQRLTKHKGYVNDILKGHKKCPSAVSQLMIKYDPSTFYIELLEAFPCNSRDELLAREAHWQRKLKAKKKGWNKCYAYLSREEALQQKKEWYEANKDVLREQKKKYYEANKDKVLKQCKEYYEANKDKVLKHCKEYYENNKEKVLKQHKEYYEAHKDVINTKLKEKFECKDCGRKIRKTEYKLHVQSTFHLNAVNGIKPKQSYYQRNKERLAKAQKERYEANKDKINAKLREKKHCDICNVSVTKHHFKRHTLSQKHKQNTLQK